MGDDTNLFNVLSRRAGRLLLPELAQALDLKPGDVYEDELWVMAIHHVAWSETPGLPFRARCSTYDVTDQGQATVIDRDAPKPALGEAPDLLLSEIHMDPFEVIAVCLDLFVSTPPDRWKTLLGRQDRANSAPRGELEYVRSLDREDKTLLLLAATVDLLKLPADEGGVDVASRGDVFRHMAGITWIPAPHIESAFKRAWSEVGRFAASAGSDTRPLVRVSDGRGGFQLNPAVELTEDLLGRWHQFIQALGTSSVCT